MTKHVAFFGVIFADAGSIPAASTNFQKHPDHQSHRKSNKTKDRIGFH